MKTMLKRGASMLMALVMCLSVLTGTGMTAFAATGDAGTITFARTYDSDGNLMRYNSSAVINGYTAGGSGALKYRMFVDIIGKQQRGDLSGVSPHIWEYRGKAEWYIPVTASDKAQIAETILDYVGMYQEEGMEMGGMNL